MSKNPESRTIEQLLAEAEELVNHINANILQDMKEEHRLRFEEHARGLNRIKSQVQEKKEKKEPYEISGHAEGVHEAILDIVKAMHDLKHNIF
ncbi:MAG: hypothetical protein V1816_09940 [Pseudomonadota bacterium]